MELPEAVAAYLRWYVRLPGTLLLLGLTLPLLIRFRSRYFGFWTAAWLVEAAAIACGAEYLEGNESAWRVPYAAFNLAYAILAAVIAWFASRARDRAIGAALVLNRVTAAGLVLDFLYHADLFAFAARPAPAVLRLMESGGIFDLGFHFLLLFLTMLACLHTTDARAGELAREVDAVRRQLSSGRELDGLTGLLNQAALAKEVDSGVPFTGVVAVCDLDNFKEVNDQYGHLVGDAILRNIGHLLRASIRQEDDAFRWGGDEFVVLFHNQNGGMVRHRMEAIQGRLKEFRLRGHGVIPISFSWGIAESDQRFLRDVLNEADQDMYVWKRRRKVS